MKHLTTFAIVLIMGQSLIHSQSVNIIPRPAQVQLQRGSFVLDAKTGIQADAINETNAQMLQVMLKPAFNLQINRAAQKKIHLVGVRALASELGHDGYRIQVTSTTIRIEAATATGVFYGMQSLRQMLPATLLPQTRQVEIQAVSITDSPRFPWRAFMLDEARHFKGIDQVKKLLDEMAMLKMNIFHWHLTDDQGWRIEIKKYPKLTEVGAFRKNTQSGGWNSEKRTERPHGGFYTQDQIREIIAYANDRHIVIVPEIEMPGHASAAIAAYPWLGTIGKAIEVPVVFGKLPDSYNVTDPRVYQFLEDVLAEVIALFPGQVIHIGGDEVKFDAWKESAQVQAFMRNNGLKSPADLQVYFTNRISNFIDSKNYRMMGWNEIMGSNVHEWQSDEDFERKESLAQSAIIHFWKGSLDLVTEAVTNGYDIVNSHHVSTYLDYGYNSIPLRKAYAFNPLPDGLAKKYHHKVLGSGCQMWSEWIPTVADLDRQVFPRLAAYAEVGWTSNRNKDYNRFKKSLQFFYERWQRKGIQYYKQ